MVSIQFRIKEPAKKEKKNCTCPSSIIAFDMINHLMDVILHVLLFLINHHVFAAWVILRSYYTGNNHIIILLWWNFQIVVTEVA